ncbi:MAG: hypothetical protein WDO56_37440 [Gammaproteobacteria bacterium]
MVKNLELIAAESGIDHGQQGRRCCGEREGERVAVEVDPFEPSSGLNEIVTSNSYHEPFGLRSTVVACAGTAQVAASTTATPRSF